MVKVIIIDDNENRTSITQICTLDLKRTHMNRMAFIADVNKMVADFTRPYKRFKEGKKP